LINFLVNLAHPGVELSNFNVMLKLSGKEHRTVYMSWYNAVINVSSFVGPLVGVWLATWLGLQGTMIVGGLLRIVGGLLFSFNRVEEPAPEMAQP
jgi:predicted MFS family arabinose efflux permease